MKIKTGISEINEENYLHMIRGAVSVLNAGGIIVYPTETSYGIGADARNINAINRIHNIKQQEKGKPIPVIVPSIAIAKKFCKIPEVAEILIKKFMPGPLTLVVEKKESVPKELSEKGVAFRISSNKIANDICKKFGSAITSTSANIHGEEPIYSGKKAIEVFLGKVDLIIDGGELPGAEASTIYDIKKGVVLRAGPISEKDIKRALGTIG